MPPFLQRAAARLLTSPALAHAHMAAAGAARAVRGESPRADFFFQVDDPYGPPALAVLAPLLARYGVALRCWLVPAPDAGAAPEAERLAAYARTDAAALSDALGLPPLPPGPPPVAAAVTRAQALAAAALDLPDPAPLLAELTRALLAGEAALGDYASRHAAADSAATAARLAAGHARRARVGHYLGSVTHYEGGLYWGVDRLPYLEARLERSRPRRLPTLLPWLDPAPAPTGGGTRPVIDFFLSFRSPYSYLAAERIAPLAEAHGAELRLRFVLPMVMRGLPVPAAKRLYILRDTKREALRFGLPFGTVVDPVGVGVERGLAVLHHAIRLGHGLDFARAFLRGAFAEGLDMTRGAGLSLVARRAGLGRAQVTAALADPSWRVAAETNRADLFALGLWGVPSFRVDNGPGLWGQDRLWRVEQALRAAHGLAPKARSVAWPAA